MFTSVRTGNLRSVFLICLNRVARKQGTSNSPFVSAMSVLNVRLLESTTRLKFWRYTREKKQLAGNSNSQPMQNVSAMMAAEEKQ